MKVDKHAKSLLEVLFRDSLANPQGTNLTKFRADHHMDLDLLDKLELSGIIKKQNNKYKLSLLALYGPLGGVYEAVDLFKKCDHIFHFLRQYYLDHPAENIGLNSLSIQSALSREDINICLSYMIDAPIFGSWSTDFLSVEDATITPAESILRHKDFSRVLKSMKSARSHREALPSLNYISLNRPAGKDPSKLALLRKLAKLYRIKGVKEGFPSKEVCLDWSNKVAPLLKFNPQYYSNFIANAHKMNLPLSSITLGPAFSIMVSQVQMAIEELKNDLDFGTSQAEAEDQMGSYIDETRLGELRSISNKEYDLTRLIDILEEINHCYRNKCYVATISLVRALIDHIPPIFGSKSFSEVANNYKGSKSFRKSMQNLDNSSRNIADQHLHCHIRKVETLPNKTQVNFSPDVDILLAEIVRILK